MRFIIIVSVILVLGCSTKQIEMTEFEKFYYNHYSPEEISITSSQTNTKTNGKLVEERDFYLLQFTNSSELNKSFEDEKYFQSETEKIAQTFTQIINANEHLDLKEIQIDIIQDSGFLIFSKKNNKSIVYYPEGN